MKTSDEKTSIFSQIFNFYLEGENIFKKSNEELKVSRNTGFKKSDDIGFDSLDSVSNEISNRSGTEGILSRRETFLMLDKIGNEKNNKKEIDKFLKEINPLIIEPKNLKIFDLELVNFINTGYKCRIKIENSNDEEILKIARTK